MRLCERFIAFRGLLLLKDALGHIGHDLTAENVAAIKPYNAAGHKWGICDDKIDGLNDILNDAGTR